MNQFVVVFFIILIAATGAAGAFYVWYWQPTMEEKENLEKEIADLERKKEEINKIDNDIANINEEIASLAKEEARLQTESNQLKTVVPKLLDSLEAIANKFDVKFQDIRISPLVRSEQWSELPVEIVILGTFNNIGNFLTICEKRKIINLANGSITVSASSETDPKSKSPLLNVTLNGKVYILGGS